MGKVKWITLFVMLGLVICFGAGAQENRTAEPSKSAEPEPKTIKYMIFMSIDGLTEERIQGAYTPNINGLAASGVKSTALGVLPANPQTFLASLLTGADPSIHGLTSAGQKIRTKTLPEVVAGYGRSSVLVAPAGTFPQSFFSSRGQNTIKNITVNNNDKAVINKAIDILNQEHPYFLGIRMPGVRKNIAGKGNPKDIAGEINSIDEQVGRLLTALRNSGAYGECLVVVTGYYSETTPRPAGILNDVDSLKLPVIMVGPGLKTGTAVPPVKITDIAPTAALLAGLQLPPESNGAVLWNSLGPGTGFREENLLLKRIKDLSEDNIRSTEMIYRLTEEKRLVRSEKENVNREKQQIQKTIEGKDSQINILKWKIRFLKLLGFCSLAALGTGYVAEYFYLKKKFLMF